MVQVSAGDAQAFCAWAGVRLPSEEEWKYAARGGDGRRYPWGDAPPEEDGGRRANFGTAACCAPDAADGYLKSAPVGRNGASPLGLMDMADNVWEWTASTFPGRPKEVVLRGGGWGNNRYCLRVSYRHGNPHDIGLDIVGFRCAECPRATAMAFPVSAPAVVMSGVVGPAPHPLTEGDAVHSSVVQEEAKSCGVELNRHRSAHHPDETDGAIGTFQTFMSRP